MQVLLSSLIEITTHTQHQLLVDIQYTYTPWNTPMALCTYIALCGKETYITELLSMKC